MFGILRPSSKETSPTPREVTPPPPRSMAPVPQGHYNNREELLEFVKHWAKEQGYAIVISRSRSNRLWLKCDRGGKYENRRHITEEQRKRKRGDSRLMGCPFMVMAVLKDGVWRVKTEIEKHNHEASEDLTAHPSLRKMTKEQMNHLEQRTEAGSTPTEIMDSLKAQWPDINLVKRDVYNARKKYKENKRNGGAPAPEQAQPWEDPNGLVPGPTPTGKWVWAEAGEELVSKGKKKRKKVFVPNPQTQPQPVLDPALQNPTPPQPADQPYPSDNLASTIGFQDFASNYQDASSSLNLQPNASIPSFDRSNSAPSPLQQLSDFSSDQVNGNFTASSIDDNSFFSHNPHQRNSFPSITTPSPGQQQGLSHSRVEPTGTMTQPQSITTRSTSAAAAQQSGFNSTPPPGQAAAAAPPRNQNGQVLMSRIERMEKEQRDQKNMLTRILGAVTGGQVPDV